MPITRAELARTVDHTLLKPEATDRAIVELCAEAAELGTYAVCVSPSRLPVTVDPSLVVCAVVGFPSGAHGSVIKAAEAALAVEHGCGEIDMVIESRSRRRRRLGSGRGRCARRSVTGWA